MHKLTIKIPIYNCSCNIIIDNDIEKTINRYVKNRKWDKTTLMSEGQYVHGLTVSNEDMKDYYIFYSIESLTVNYIIHEISHMIDFLITERDIEDKGEARAYLTGYISEKIFDFIFKKSLLINKWYKPQISDNQKISDEKPSGLL